MKPYDIAVVSSRLDGSMGAGSHAVALTSQTISFYKTVFLLQVEISGAVYTNANLYENHAGFTFQFGASVIRNNVYCVGADIIENPVYYVNAGDMQAYSIGVFYPANTDLDLTGFVRMEVNATATTLAYLNVNLFYIVR